MKLQRITIANRNEQTKKLYYDLDGSAVISDDGISLKRNATLDLCTYFNCFSAEKWEKYTEVKRIRLVLELSGCMEVRGYRLFNEGGRKRKKQIFLFRFESAERSVFRTEEIDLAEGGLIGVTLCSCSDTAAFYSGYYETDYEKELRNVQIGIGICTYKREAYVKRNMDLLKKEILHNPEAYSHGHVGVCISDNAGTLRMEEIADSDIRVVRNKNLGGVGGFTRTMLEYMQGERDITHVLLMDDDAVLSVDAIERTYTMLCVLKPENEQYVIGGALLREDVPYLQFESGAQWNDGEIVALKHDFDLRSWETVVENESEEAVEYTGWWYSCIPMSFIREHRLPLPFFVHRDDIEYGLRAKGHFILLNGICVWHESFENKLPGAIEYYDVRNLAITNAIHSPGYTASDFKKMLFVQVSSNVGKYRYKYVDLNLRGAVDFLRGFRWFYRTDTLKCHKDLAKYGYTAIDAENYIGYKGIRRDDLQTCSELNDEAPGRIVRLWKLATMNGHFLPARKGPVAVVRPFPNIYDLYRQKEVVYVDSAGKAVHVQRSRKELLGSYVKLWRVCRLIDRYFETACEGYRRQYRKLETEDYWSRYLGLKL